ncbi:MAG: hypothetical protein WAW96_02085, partial [Alphaproteobacteria bacterium]
MTSLVKVSVLDEIWFVVFHLPQRSDIRLQELEATADQRDRGAKIEKSRKRIRRFPRPLTRLKSLSDFSHPLPLGEGANLSPLPVG